MIRAAQPEKAVPNGRATIFRNGLDINILRVGDTEVVQYLERAFDTTQDSVSSDSFSAPNVSRSSNPVSMSSSVSSLRSRYCTVKADFRPGLDSRAEKNLRRRSSGEPPNRLGRRSILEELS